MRFSSLDDKAGNHGSHSEAQHILRPMYEGLDVFFFFLSLVFLGLHLRFMEVPTLGSDRI